METQRFPNDVILSHSLGLSSGGQYLEDFKIDVNCDHGRYSFIQ